jgi:hypothetical protein
MRTVKIEIKTLTMVPVVSTIVATVTIPNGKPLGPVPDAIVNGPIPDYMNLDDSSIQSFRVKDSEPDDFDLEEQLQDYCTLEDASSVVLNYKVSK